MTITVLVAPTHLDEFHVVDAATRREFIAMLTAAGLLAACGDNGGGGGGDAAAPAMQTRSVIKEFGTFEIPVEPPAGRRARRSP